MSSAPDPSAREKQLRMLRALDEAAAKLEAVERARAEPIAIIGAGCRFPGGARDLAAYWRLLERGIDATGDMPLDRWDIDALYDPNPDVPGTICARRGAFLPDIDRFDAEHFNISPREATTLDPQHRLLLEMAHEALDSAGQLHDRLAENLTGVFIGVTNNDYAHLLREYKADRPLDAYFITGNAPNGAAGRLSYQLGLRGPSLVLDTACSSSLTSVQVACQSLRQRECHLAVAGGINLLVMPDTYTALSRARLLAADGRCKTFDAAADGYGRGEGGGLIVLKRLSDAQRDGDRILATIRGGAINHDGPSSGFTVPNGAAQRALLQQALTASRLGPLDVDYIEAHGTGTTLGDPIEVNALVDVYGPGRTATNPLLLGSVKTNLGHLESGAGIAGILKVALSLWHRQLPRHLHFRNPTPRIPWAEIPVRVTAEHAPWPDPGRPRRAGVSSFGVSGTNVHLILEEPPTPATERTTLPLPKKRFHGRQRYWAFARPQYASARTWLHDVTWQPAPRRDRATTNATCDLAAGSAAVAAWSATAPTRYAGPAYAAILPALEALAAAYAAAAVTALGPAAIIAPRHARLWQRIQHLATSASASPAPDQLAALRRTQPDASIELNLLERCGSALPAVLRGDTDPLTLLFPADTTPTAADLYSANPVARALNDLIATWLAAAAPTDRPLRILEIGAGTGATTATVLQALGDREVSYTFTDVAPLFLAQAQQRFAAQPALTCQPLDIERDPFTQGFAPGEFDLIIGANVLHATRDLTRAVRHTRQLLAGSGCLALIELTAPLGFLDLIFGLTEGWWHFADTSLRPDYPLLGPSAWTDLLSSTGFTAATVHTPPATAGEVYRQQALITATAAGPAPVATQLAGRWSVLGAPSPELIAGLREHGAELTADSPDAVVFVAPPSTSPLDTTALRTALELTQAHLEAPRPLWFVTTGAQAVNAADAVPQLAHAALWGFARTAVQEHPDLPLRRLDLDPTASPAEAAADLLREFAAPSTEDQLAFRAGQRFAARLVPHPAPEPADDFTVSTEGTVLIVGGLGGLGLSLAHWLGEHGARHLVLAGRSAPSAEALAAIARLEVEGLSIRTAQLDVSDTASVARTLAQIAAEGPPLCGVIHSAGVLDDGALRQLDWSRFPTVLEPKIAGTWHLHEQTRDLPLDFFVLFSSSTALFGTPGQANHAAANAWLDAFAAHRRAAGLPAVSINWGPWGEIGAAARRGVDATARRHGFDLITPVKGWHLLGDILQSDQAQVAVLPVNWPQVPAHLTVAPFFDAVRITATPTAALPAPAAPAATPTPPTTDWAVLPATTRATRLREAVRTAVVAVLGLDADSRIDPAKGFFALGMDSLTAVELRSRLQTALSLSLPSTVVFDHPTVGGLAQHLAGLFNPASATPPAPTPVTPSRETTTVSGDELSDLLEDELKDL